jgi:hypothetical protein
MSCWYNRGAGAGAGAGVGADAGADTDYYCYCQLPLPINGSQRRGARMRARAKLLEGLGGFESASMRSSSTAVGKDEPPNCFRRRRVVPTPRSSLSHPLSTHLKTHALALALVLARARPPPVCLSVRLPASRSASALPVALSSAVLQCARCCSEACRLCECAAACDTDAASASASSCCPLPPLPPPVCAALHCVSPLEPPSTSPAHTHTSAPAASTRLAPQRRYPSFAPSHLLPTAGPAVRSCRARAWDRCLCHQAPWRCAQRRRFRLHRTFPSSSCSAPSAPFAPPFAAPVRRLTTVHATHCTTCLRPRNPFTHSTSARHPPAQLQTSVGWSPLPRWRPWNMAHAMSSTWTAEPTTSM